MTIRYLPHTADIRMSIEASSLPMLFKFSLRGMANILSEDYCTQKRKHQIRQKIVINSPDITCVLIDFLSQVLSLSYVHKAIFCDLQIKELSDQFLQAEIAGSKIDGYDEEIKAVTYHEASVQQNLNTNWETIIVFDI